MSDAKARLRVALNMYRRTMSAVANAAEAVLAETPAVQLVHKLCPFCGGEPRGLNGGDNAWIKCSRCGVVGPGDVRNLGSAWERWDSRAAEGDKRMNDGELFVISGSREWAMIMAMRGYTLLVGDPSRPDWTVYNIHKGPADGWRLSSKSQAKYYEIPPDSTPAYDSQGKLIGYWL